jgi:hypothetical protein
MLKCFDLLWFGTILGSLRHCHAFVSSIPSWEDAASVACAPYLANYQVPWLCSIIWRPRIRFMVDISFISSESFWVIVNLLNLDGSLR